MKKPNVGTGILVAFVMACGAAIGWPLVRTLFPWHMEMPIMIAMISGLYGAYLLATCEDRSGKALLVVLGIALTAVTLIVPMSELKLIGLHGLWLWVVRSLCFQRTFFGAAMDGALLLVGAAVGLAVARWTHGVFLPVWSVFLLQAMFPYIPASWQASNDGESVKIDRFARSHRMAEAAIKQMVTK